MRTVCETQDTKVCLKDWGNHNNKCMRAWYHPAAQHLGKYHINSRSQHIYSWNKQPDGLNEDTVHGLSTAQVRQSLWNGSGRQCRIVSLNSHMWIHTHTPSLDSSTFVSATLPPSSDINQQARFPETENPLSKRKASNTCVSEERARTRVKNQARHHLITCGEGVKSLHQHVWALSGTKHARCSQPRGSGEHTAPENPGHRKNNVSSLPSTAVTWDHILWRGASHICPPSPLKLLLFARGSWLIGHQWRRASWMSVNTLGSQGQPSPSRLHTIR